MAGIAIILSFMPVSSLLSQNRPLPAIDYAGVIYDYDTVANKVLTLDRAPFKVTGQNHMFSTSLGVYLDNKASEICLSVTQPTFLLKLRSKDIDPTPNLGFCTFKVLRKARVFNYLKTSKFGNYTFNNEIKTWTIKKVADDVVMLTPNSPLPPGEYSLYIHAGGVPRESFAFGIK
jgi:hypothetical protein